MTQRGHIGAIASLQLGISRAAMLEANKPHYIFLMHDDGSDDDENDWTPYLETLKKRGSFEGGSAVGDGVCLRKAGPVPSLTRHLTGYIRVTADGIENAKAMLAGNPHYENGGTVEIRELLRTD